MKTSNALVLAAAALLLVSGCGGESIDVTREAPFTPFVGGGQAATPAADYPSGPYGVGIGSVVVDMRFIGYASTPELDHDREVVSPSVEMALSDFYNPTGDEVYPAGSLRGEGGPKPTMLLVAVEQVWCGPSSATADALAQRHSIDRRVGVEYLEILEDGGRIGVPANLDDLDLWEAQHEPLYPVAIDPEGTVNALAQGWPFLIEIDTATMRIVNEHLGNPDNAFWFAFEEDVAATRR